MFGFDVFVFNVFDKKLKERHFNTYNFYDHDNNKFILSLRKTVYPYEYMDDCKKFNETTLAEKEDFYSHLNMKNIIDADYTCAKRECEDFEIKSYENIKIFMLKVIHYC